MKPIILMCDTCGATVPEMGATPEQRRAMLPARDGGNLMLRRRAAAVARAQLPGGTERCPRCDADMAGKDAKSEQEIGA